MSAKNQAAVARAVKAANEKKRDVYSQVLNPQISVITSRTMNQKTETEAFCKWNESAATPAEMGSSAEKTSQRIKLGCGSRFLSASAAPPKSVATTSKMGNRNTATNAARISA